MIGEGATHFSSALHLSDDKIFIMKEISLEGLKAYRARTFGLLPSKKLTSPAEAASFVEARGFVYFWPIKGIPLPNLWMGVAGDRPVPNEHDDPGHITWGWKDNALGKKIWYYGKILRQIGRAHV